MNNQSETSKCEMESGDENTGQYRSACFFFLSVFFFFFLHGGDIEFLEFYLLIQQVSESDPNLF